MSKYLLALWTFQDTRNLSSFPIQWLEDFCPSPLIMAGYLDILMTGNSFPGPGIPTLFPQSFVEPGKTNHPFLSQRVMWWCDVKSITGVKVINPIRRYCKPCDNHVLFKLPVVPIVRSKKWLCNPLSHFWRHVTDIGVFLTLFGVSSTGCLASTGRSSTSMVDILDDLIYDKSYSHNVS